MSGGKGSQQTGSATSSAESRAGAAQFPFFQAGLQNAGRIYGDADTYPNYAPATPEQIGGYQDLYNTARGTVGQGLQPQAYDAYGRLISGGGQSPATGGYSTLAAGGTGPQQTLDQVVRYGVNNALNFANPIAGYANEATAGNVGQDELGAMAVGADLTPTTNPYLSAMANASLRKVQDAYSLTTAPTTAFQFGNTGRGNSGANNAAIRANQDQFATNLGEISNNFYGTAYDRDKTRQLTAATAFDQARRAGLGLGITGLGTAGNLVDTGLRTITAAATPNLLAQGTGIAGIDTGFNRSEQERLAALQVYPQFAGAQFLGPQQEVAAGTGQQQLTQQAYNAPFERLKQYMATIGSPSGGTSSTQPIFGNPLTSALSGATGILGLGKELGLGGSGGLGGLGSAGGFFGSQGPLFGTLADASIAAGGPPLALELGTAGAAGLEGLPIAAAAGGWIVCTELMRQGRMPKRHYLAGWPVFAAYPERGKRGYYLWAIPLVRHLRKKPDSLLSRAAGAAFRWRAEDIAARAGVKGARKLWRGRAVTAVLYPLCAMLGWFVPPQDWSAVYREEQTACSQ